MTAVWYDCKRNGCYTERQPSWRFLDGIGRTTVRVSDVDGFLVRYETGNMLLIEWKHEDGNGIPNGQRWALQNATQRNPDPTAVQAVVLYGTPPDTVTAMRWCIAGEWSPKDPVAGKETVRRMVEAWWNVPLRRIGKLAPAPMREERAM